MWTTDKYQSQRGALSVELAFVGVLAFVILTALIEIGRALYTWTALTEATRLGARAAAVCGVQDAAIMRTAMFADHKLLPNLDASNIAVNYLDADNNAVADPNGAGYARVRYVQVSIQGYQFTSSLPGIRFTLPEFITTVPRQSLGITPDEAPGC